MSVASAVAAGHEANEPALEKGGGIERVRKPVGLKYHSSFFWLICQISCYFINRRREGIIKQWTLPYLEPKAYLTGTLGRL